MGGKGIRRREKNYRAAHGGNNRLPPPPKPSQVDALPSKLRKIISFTSPNHNSNGSAAELSKRVGEKRERAGNSIKKAPREEDVIASEDNKDKDESDHGEEAVVDSGDEERSNNNNKKRKRKRKMQVDDLRFGASGIGMTKTKEKRRERKKKYLEAKKKKQKKLEAEETLNFPGREQIKFGDVVQAPPKLVALPKVPKNQQDASQERIRLQAVEAYRKRKGWTSRPGLQLPSLITAAPSL